jgi:O-antigen chain-terminating methyltransferase
MKRIIEELIEKRKAKQEKLEKRLGELAGSIGKFTFFNGRKGEIGEKFAAIGADIADFVTAQDREWDAYAGNHSTMVFKSLEWKIERLENEYSNLHTLLARFVGLERALDRLIESAGGKTDGKTIGEIRSIKEKLSVFQYSGFEDRFRGDEDAVRQKLKKYVSHFPAGRDVLDFGCGRGEFLELLREGGRIGRGVDLAGGMLDRAREKGLAVLEGDALEHLKTLPDGSLGGIFSSQVIEHLAPEYLRGLVRESLRVLRVGGVLLMETINPLSLFALSRIFFLDPSHRQPLHPEYLRYLLDGCGFSGVEILYSAEPADEMLRPVGPDQPTALVFNENVDRLNRILFASPEFAVKGTKA